MLAMGTLCITFVCSALYGVAAQNLPGLTTSPYASSVPLLQDIILAGGSQGYPLSPTHTDLRDTKIATSAEATLGYFHRQNVPADPSRSVW